MIEADFELKSKLTTRLQFPKSIGGSVQSSQDLLDFGFIFKWKRKAGGPCARAVDRARMAGPRIHHGPHSARRSEFTGARPSGHFSARRHDAGRGKQRGRSTGAHRGLRWPVRLRGEAGGGDGRTAAVKLGG
jgi:hypothetical protein